jgi:hypothetical protein
MAIVDHPGNGDCFGIRTYCGNVDESKHRLAGRRLEEEEFTEISITQFLNKKKDLFYKKISG